jgi:prophage DNA circulation protein
MSLIIPNTFANRTTSVELSKLDDNFTYLGTQIDTTNTAVSGLSTTVSGLSTTVSGLSTTVSGLSTSLTTSSVILGAWTVTESAGSLFFKHSGVNKMKLDTSGNLSVVGDVTAFETL